MKKYISLLFIVILLIGFIGCKQFSEDNSEKDDDSIFPSVELVDIKIIAEPAKTEYFINEEELNLVGLKVIANYSDGKTEDVTPEVVIKGFNSALKTDSQIITVIFNKKKATFTIKIIGPAPEPEYNPETDPNNSENPPNDETYTVILESFAADKKIAVIKAIREITALGLGESKAFVESAPQVIKKGVSLKDADEIIKKIEEAGGKASKKGEI